MERGWNHESATRTPFGDLTLIWHLTTPIRESTLIVVWWESANLLQRTMIYCKMCHLTTSVRESTLIVVWRESTHILRWTMLYCKLYHLLLRMITAFPRRQLWRPSRSARKRHRLLVVSQEETPSVGGIPQARSHRLSHVRTL